MQNVHDITLAKYKESRQKELADTDALTGLYNRRAFRARVRSVLCRHDNVKRCALIMIDLDNLKDINDSEGHQVGDEALKTLAESIGNHFRSTDIKCRLGGDEFIVFLPEISGAATLRNTLVSFQNRLVKHRVGDNGYLEITCSIGCTFGTTGTDEYDKLYAQADRALYHVKKNGKNDFAFYERQMDMPEYHYMPHSGTGVTHTEWYDEDEYKRLLEALENLFPLVVSANLTKNTYYMMEYAKFATHKSPDIGVFDNLIETSMPTFHPDDRESFLDKFSRESLLRAYNSGEKSVIHEGRQLGDDDVYRWVRSVLIFVKNDSGDICEITFSRIIEK